MFEHSQAAAALAARTLPLTFWLEAMMLVCFGMAWPLANWRMLRRRRAEGKGLPFTLIILSGYAAGSLAKLIPALAGGPLSALFWLYLCNGAMVALNLGLQWHYARRPAEAAVPAIG